MAPGDSLDSFDGLRGVKLLACFEADAGGDALDHDEAPVDLACEGHFLLREALV